MARTYDSSRRVQAAERTRETILATAFRLHGLGILDVETLAQEADVSVATVRKQFPTRELLFEGCTEFGMNLVPMPDFDLIGSMADPHDRTRLAVRQTYRLHESLSGQMWGAFKLEDESDAMVKVIAQVEGLTSLMADLILAAWSFDEGRINEVRGFVVGLLHPLTYRALRTYGRLSPEQAVDRSVDSLIHCLAGPALALREEVAHH